MVTAQGGRADAREAESESDRNEAKLAESTEKSRRVDGRGQSCGWDGLPLARVDGRSMGSDQGSFFERFRSGAENLGERIEVDGLFQVLGETGRAAELALARAG